jgi:hypothetical protein
MSEMKKDELMLHTGDISHLTAKAAPETVFRHR